MKRVFILGAAVAAALVPVSIAPAHADGVSLVVEGCSVQVPSGANGFAALDTAIATGCPTVSSYSQSGGFLDCMNGLCGQSVLSPPSYPVYAGTYWGFYVNGQYSMVGLGDYSASNGDVLLFDYEAYAFPAI